MTVASAAWPVSVGHRKSAVVTSTTIRAQPIAAADVAMEARRALKMIMTPSNARTAGIQETKRLSWSEVDTRATAESNPERNVGLKACWVSDPVSAVSAIGSCISQLLIALPMTASG